MAFNATNPVVVGEPTKKADYDRAFDNTLALFAGAGHVEQTTTVTGTQNNFALNDGAVVFLRLDNTSVLTLTGLTGGVAGRVLILLSRGTARVDIPDNAAGSSAANRVWTHVTGTISLAPGYGRAILVYDGTDQKWKVIAHEQGAWLTPTFAAGDYTASGSMTWTVDSGDVSIMRYLLRGRTLQVTFSLSTTTVGGTLSSQLKIKIPGGFTADQGLTNIPYIRNNNASGNAMSILQVQAGSTVIDCLQDIGGNNWATSTNNTYLYGSITFDVQ